MTTICSVPISPLWWLDRGGRTRGSRGWLRGAKLTRACVTRTVNGTGHALGERPPAVIDPRAHAGLRVPDGRRRGGRRRPGPLRRRAGTGRRTGQARPRRVVRPLTAPTPSTRLTAK